MNGRDLKNLLLGGLLGGAGLWALAAVPNTFQAGQVISASQVNQNFAALSAAVEGIAGRFGGGMTNTNPQTTGGCDDSDGMLGEVFLFAGDFAPNRSMPADGRVLPIAQNTALFSLFGTRYGGNGTTTFALPDLRDVAPRSANGQPVSYFVCTAGVFPSRD